MTDKATTKNIWRAIQKENGRSFRNGQEPKEALNIPASLRLSSGLVRHVPIDASTGCLEQEPSTSRHDVFRRNTPA
ncbi:hypothetical protein [Methylovirgula sp. HY1]|uniref:hypothetical protein n=1 Tax=Methylovirgula sp. HY1 TaxID=2822761 RepID=UPI001C5B296B|nr:hypothetical protein [Methylovirgula sp. HY1]QXX76526.1 hypothetical protein MHY1_p00048 [Methylovirgula sp. HY1]